jgi:hypothetical protein
MVKKGLIILSIIIILLAVINFLILDKNKKTHIDIDVEEVFCPEVCLEMWVFEQNACVFDSCGSGCGPDNLKTFATQEECLNMYK